MNICSFCHKKTYRNTIFKGEIVGDCCSEECILGICATCRSNVCIEIVKFNFTYPKCINCSAHNNRKFDILRSDINSAFQEFKIEFPLFRNSRFFFDEEISDFIETLKTSQDIVLTFHDLLNRELNFLSEEQVVIISKYIEGNIQNEMKTTLYHL